MNSLSIFKNIFYFLIGYIALFLTIVPHEFGHGVAYAYYGCKENIWDLNVPFHFIFSTPAPLSIDCVKNLSLFQDFIANISGVATNLIFFFIGYIFIGKPKNRYLEFFLILFCLNHLLEAFSYLTLNIIYPVSDMVSVQNYEPLLRIPLFCVGAGLFIYIRKIVLLTQIPLKRLLIIYSIIMVLLFGGIRIVFDILGKGNYSTC